MEKEIYKKEWEASGVYDDIRTRVRIVSLDEGEYVLEMVTPTVQTFSERLKTVLHYLFKGKRIIFAQAFLSKEDIGELRKVGNQNGFEEHDSQG